MSWPKPQPSTDQCRLVGPTGQYVRGIDPRGRPLYSRKKEDAWLMSRTYAYKIKNVYQLRSYRVESSDT